MAGVRCHHARHAVEGALARAREASPQVHPSAAAPSSRHHLPACTPAWPPSDFRPLCPSTVFPPAGDLLTLPTPRPLGFICGRLLGGGSHTHNTHTHTAVPRSDALYIHVAQRALGSHALQRASILMFCNVLWKRVGGFGCLRPTCMEHAHWQQLGTTVGSSRAVHPHAHAHAHAMLAERCAHHSAARGSQPCCAVPD